MKRPIVILDIETTGLDPLAAVPLEVAMVHVELDGDRLVERAHWQVYLRAPPLESWEPGALTMHRQSGLLSKLHVLSLAEQVGRPGSSLHQSEIEPANQLVRARLQLSWAERARWCCAWLDDVVHAGGGPREVIACGANVGRFDLTILRRTMPALAGRFFYRALDVSAIKVAASQLGWADEPERPKTHRALDDCRATLADLNHYHALLRRGGLYSCA